MRKAVFNESFTHFQDAVYFMENHLIDHSHLFIDEAKIAYINGNWNVGLLFSDAQKELELDE
jgi:hypothetical protein